MYFVYILHSEKYSRYYIGHCKNCKSRLKDHNRGKVKSTKAYVPWNIVHTEQFETKSEAYQREMEIKSYKSGEAFKRLIQK
ncbi:MAG: GIY-YIG nuclease family protein [Melioribacteraceae bacterium]|nr:GIY-YIG nuclease family protein [Melioribacteraceae bacterium]